MKLKKMVKKKKKTKVKYYRQDLLT